MVRTVPKRRVSCTALVLVKASRVRHPLASTQWVLGTSSLIKDESKAFIGVRPSSCLILCCLFKLYTLHAKVLNVSTSGFEQVQHQWRTKCERVFLRRWSSCGETDAQPHESAVGGYALRISHATSSSRLNYDDLTEERGSQSRPSSKGAGVFPLLGHGDHRVYQTCRSAAIGRPSYNRIAWWWRYRDERRHAVCMQPSRHRHCRKWPREGDSWRGGTRNGGESERRRRRWWELKGGDEIKGGRVGEANQQGGRISPPSHMNMISVSLLLNPIWLKFYCFS